MINKCYDDALTAILENCKQSIEQIKDLIRKNRHDELKDSILILRQFLNIDPFIYIKTADDYA